MSACDYIKPISYRKTKKGIINVSFCNQKTKSKRRNDNPPNYTLSELREWALNQSVFHELYNLWLISEYDKLLKPSFDRNNDYLPYTLDNLTIMTWGDNNKKAQQDRRNGVNNKISKSVIQSELDGTLISTHHSGRHASRVTGVDQRDISKCCRGINKTAGGFKWEFSSL